MVKPALPHLEVIQRVREATRLRVVAYYVSGEYAMIKAAAERGRRRDFTYAVLEYARWEKAGSR